MLQDYNYTLITESDIHYFSRLLAGRWRFVTYKLLANSQIKFRLAITETLQEQHQKVRFTWNRHSRAAYSQRFEKLVFTHGHARLNRRSDTHVCTQRVLLYTREWICPCENPYRKARRSACDIMLGQRCPYVRAEPNRTHDPLPTLRAHSMKWNTLWICLCVGLKTTLSYTYLYVHNMKT